MFESYPFTLADASSDRFKRIMAWLVGQGLPEGQIATRESKFPGHAPVIEYYVEFRKAGFTDQDVNAGLLLRGPSIIVTNLQVAFKVGNPAEASFFDYVREVPTPGMIPTPLPERPANPIGPQIEGDPDSYLGKPGETYPVGKVYTSPEGVKYIKRGRFIFSAISEWWDRVP